MLSDLYELLLLLMGNPTQTTNAGKRKTTAWGSISHVICNPYLSKAAVALLAAGKARVCSSSRSQLLLSFLCVLCCVRTEL